VPRMGFVAGSDTRDRILDAALEAFGTRGLDGTSLDDLAEQLGVRKQTILYHFGSKHDLFAATIDAAVGDLGTAMVDAGRGRTGWPAVESVVNTVFRIAVRQPERLGLLREKPPAWVASGRIECVRAWLPSSRRRGCF